MSPDDDNAVFFDTVLYFYVVIKSVFKWIALAIIRFYQMAIRPLLPNACRFTPSCSQYATEAVNKYGPFKGGWLALKRLSRCHPWGGQGYDPLP